MKGYLLVRVALNVGEGRWFSHGFAPTGMSESEQISQAAADRTDCSSDRGQRVSDGRQRAAGAAHPTGFLRKYLWEYRERHRRLRFRRQQRKQFEEVQIQVSQEMQRFLAELSQTVDDRYECRFVYADAVRKCLALPEDWSHSLRENESLNKAAIAEACWLPLLWQKYWQFPEFDAFLQPQWVEPLLENARLHHFVVLGLADSTPAAILHCAHSMKNLRWFLQERDCGQEVQDFVEDFYEDYGLAVTLQPLLGERAFARLLLETMEPVCVLDFTGEPHIPTGGLARGSIWIDFCSVEEKGRRILERGTSISYFSVKETWKRAGKP